MIYQFEEFELDTRRHELRYRDEVRPLERQVFALLELLVKHHDRLVHKDEIHEKIWNGRVVSESVVNTRIRSVRIALDDDGKSQRLVKTSYGLGFRFVGDVVIIDTDEHIPPEPANPLLPTPGERSTQQEPATPVELGQQEKYTRPRLISNVTLAGLLLVAGVWWFSTTYNQSADNSTIPSLNATASAQASIAVLPFVDMSEQLDQKYLADGIAEELLNVLAQVKGLKVSSRTSSFVFRDSPDKLNEIGRELGVDHVLEGSVRKAGDTVRVTVQLIDIASDSHIWSKTYDRDLTAENLLLLQDDVALAVVNELADSLDLSIAEFSPRIASIQAYESHLRGLELMRRKDPAALEQALASFTNAISIAPNYAPSYAGLARAHMLSTFYAGKSRQEVLPTIKHNIERAMLLAPDNPEVLFASAGLAQMESRHEDVLNFTEKAIAINPNYSPAYGVRAGVLPMLGRLDETLDAYRHAVALDPLSPGLLSNYAWTLLAMGDLKNAFLTAIKNVNWNPKSPDALNILASVLREKADYAGAEENLRKSFEINPKGFSAQENLVTLYMDLGLLERAQAIAQYSTQKAKILALRGQQEAARQLLVGHGKDFGASEAAYLAKDYQMAHQRIYRTVTESLLPRGNDLKERQGLRLAELCYVFTQTADPVSDDLCELLQEYYAMKEPSEFKYWEDYLGGVAHQLLSGQSDLALQWLDEAIDKGHAFLYLHSRPLFEPLTQHPAYAERISRMQINAQAHRENMTSE